MELGLNSFATLRPPYVSGRCPYCCPCSSSVFIRYSQHVSGAHQKVPSSIDTAELIVLRSHNALSQGSSTMSRRVQKSARFTGDFHGLSARAAPFRSATADSRLQLSRSKVTSASPPEPGNALGAAPRSDDVRGRGRACGGQTGAGILRAEPGVRQARRPGTRYIGLFVVPDTAGGVNGQWGAVLTDVPEWRRGCLLEFLGGVNVNK